MTYKSASDWSDNNVSKEDFTSFDEWYDYVVFNHFQGVDIDKTGEFKNLMRNYWLEEMGKLDLTEPEEPEPEPSEDIDKQREALEKDIQQTSEPIRQEIQRGREEVFGVKEVEVPQTKGQPLIRKTKTLPSGEVVTTLTRQPEVTVRQPTPTVTVTERVSRLERFRQRLVGLFRRKKQ